MKCFARFAYLLEEGFYIQSVVFFSDGTARIIYSEDTIDGHAAFAAELIEPEKFDGVGTEEIKAIQELAEKIKAAREEANK